MPVGIDRRAGAGKTMIYTYGLYVVPLAKFPFQLGGIDEVASSQDGMIRRDSLPDIPR